MSLLAVEQQLRTALLANASIAAAVGTRIYVEPLPQNGRFPAMSMQRISTIYNYVHGDNGMFADFGWTRIQLDIWDNTAADSFQLVSQQAQYVRETLRTFKATNQSKSANRVMNLQIRPLADLQPIGYRAILDLKIYFADNT